LNSIITPAQDDQVFISRWLQQLLLRAGRHILEGRFCAPAAAFLCAGILTAKLVEIQDSSWTLVFLIPALALLLATVKRQRQTPTFQESGAQGASPYQVPAHGKIFLLGTGAFFFFLGLHITTDEMRLGKDFEPSTATCSVYATVSKTLGTAEDFRILLLEAGYNHSENSALPGCGRLFLRNDSISLSSGDRIAFRSRIRKPRNRDNPGEFDWVSYCRNDRILWLVAVG
jgi:hypothetical protein